MGSDAQGARVLVNIPTLTLGAAVLLGGWPTVMSETIYRTTLDSPLGTLRLVFTSGGLAAIALPEEPSRPGRYDRWMQRVFPGAQLQSTLPGGSAHAEVVQQLDQYFEGHRRVFDLPLDLRGSPFQKVVWSSVARIPFGRIASYSEIAHLAGSPAASRAVGAANGANPIPLVIPCHRVVGADGSLTGYGGGLPAKRWLLVHEGVLRDGAPQPVQMSLFARGSAPVGQAVE